jgi:hypothetical protein
MDQFELYRMAVAFSVTLARGCRAKGPGLFARRASRIRDGRLRPP